MNLELSGMVRTGEAAFHRPIQGLKPKPAISWLMLAVLLLTLLAGRAPVVGAEAAPGFNLGGEGQGNQTPPQPATIPEPSALVLFGTCSLAAVWIFRRRC